MKTETEFPISQLTKHQKKTFGPAVFTNSYGRKAWIKAEVRHDDQCGNGHNSFAVTGEMGEMTASGKHLRAESFGCLHEEIAKAFPELAPLIKWHLCSTDGPMHYVANTLYHAGDRDHNGLNKGEFRQHTSRGPNQNGGVEGVPNWVLELPDRQSRDVYAMEKPAPITLEWKAYGKTGEGKERELNHARSSAIWPEATDEQLCAEPEELKAMLLERLPALMDEFRKAVESLGFTY